MNRIKVWAYAIAVGAAAFVTVRAHTIQLRAEAAAEQDARLAAASAQVLASARATGHDVAAAAALAARDANLVAALHARESAPPAPLPRKARRGAPPPAPRVDREAQENTLREAARAALAGAERALGHELPGSTVITAGNREWLATKGAPGEAEGESSMGYLRDAVAGKARRGLVRLNGVLYHAAASPAGDGGGLVVLAPLDETWARGLAASTGVQVTVSAPDVKPVSTAGADAPLFAGWKAGAGLPVDVGAAGKLSFSLGPVKLPLPAFLVPFAQPPAHRARAVALEGAKDALVVLSSPVPPFIAPIARFHGLALLASAALLLAGLVLGFLVRVAEAPAAVPDALLAAATRIEGGDFAARAPQLAGTFGTLAAALNRAAELAGPAAAAASAKPSVTDEFFARAIRPGAQVEPAPTPAPAPPAAEPAQAPAPELLQAAARAAPPAAAAAEGDEETHFQQVFQDFLRTRASCGEASEGLTYDKFRLKLDGNKAALVAKYGCRTVRFQVYVKDGKAALKATPVK